MDAYIKTSIFSFVLNKYYVLGNNNSETFYLTLLSIKKIIFYMSINVSAKSKNCYKLG